MEQLVKDVEQRLEAFLIKSEAARKAYQDRVIAKGESLNNGLKPTLGSGGRLHAPTDFYTYEWEVDESLMEKEFMAGEFLPWDRFFNPDQLVFTSYEPSKGGRRIDYVEVEMAEALIKAFSHLGPVGVSSGKEFESKGKYVCHVYVDTRCKEAFEMIEDFVHGPRREAARIEREKEEAIYEAAEPVPTGRVEITGTVLGTKAQDTQFGTVYKMLVRDDRGFKVWGSIPSSLDYFDPKGREIKFMAAVEPADDDPKFGFFKRPTKAEFTDSIEEIA